MQEPVWNACHVNLLITMVYVTCSSILRFRFVIFLTEGLIEVATTARIGIILPFNGSAAIGRYCRFISVSGLLWSGRMGGCKWDARHGLRVCHSRRVFE